MACNHKNNGRDEEQFEVKHILFTSEEDDPGPPPPAFMSRFNSLEEWLFNVCNEKKPKKPIGTYSFALFEGENNFTLCLTGINTYELSKYHTQTRIDFAPTDMYFTLPQSECIGLKREQVLERITSQLKKFTTTDKFNHSFFSEAKSIASDWKGEIWSR